MSATHKYIRAVWRLDGVDAPAKFVLAYLADLASDAGESHPGLGTISVATGLGLTTVKHAIRRLREAGLFTYTPGHTGHANTYWLTLPPASFLPDKRRVWVDVARPGTRAGAALCRDMPEGRSGPEIGPERTGDRAGADLGVGPERTSTPQWIPQDPPVIPQQEIDSVQLDAGPPVSPAGEIGRDEPKDGRQPVVKSRPTRRPGSSVMDAYGNLDPLYPIRPDSSLSDGDTW